MSDKDEEIKELKERLEKLEESNPKEQKKEKAEPGCLSQIFALLFIVIVVSYFLYDDSETSSSTEDVTAEQQKTTPLEDPNDKHRAQLIDILTEQGFLAYWGQDNSLWIENPGVSESELERYGYKFCDVTRSSGWKQSYIITFWQSLRNGPSGQILKVNCF